MSVKLHVRNLSHTTRDHELRRLFSAHGAVSSARVLDHLKTGIITTSGLVEMDSESAAEAVIAALNGQEYDGQILAVSRATAGQQGSPGGLRAIESADLLAVRSTDTCRGPRPGGFGDRGGRKPRGGTFFVTAESDRRAPAPAGQPS